MFILKCLFLKIIYVQHSHKALFKLVVPLNLILPIALEIINTTYICSNGIHFYNDDDIHHDSIIIMYFYDDVMDDKIVTTTPFHFVALLLLGERKGKMGILFLK